MQNGDGADGEGEGGLTWIQHFCGRPENSYLVEVEEEFIDDAFNMYGLEKLVPYYETALDIILDFEIDDDELRGKAVKTLKLSAMKLYGLIHARYILTPNGMKKMRSKINEGVFGCCQRVKCNEQSLLPVGIYNVPGEETVKLYCPKCKELYLPNEENHSMIDGAYFGTSFPHLYVMQYPDVIEESDDDSSDSSSGDCIEFVPTVFGFKIGKRPKHMSKKPFVFPRKTFVCY